MTKRETINALEYLIDFFKQFNEALDEQEKKYQK